MQKALPSTKQKLSKLVGGMSEDVAREVLHYAQFLPAKNEGEKDFDAALNDMPKNVAQMFVDEAKEAKSKGELRPLFDKNGKLVKL